MSATIYIINDSDGVFAVACRYCAAPAYTKRVTAWTELAHIARYEAKIHARYVHDIEWVG